MKHRVPNTEYREKTKEMNSTIENRKSKISGLPLKLAIFVLVLFALVITAMLLWKPVKVKYYASKLQSDEIKVRQAYAKKLLDMGTREPVFLYYIDRYNSKEVQNRCNSKEVQKRMEMVEELCAVGDKGKAVMKDIFKNWCYKPSQQAKIPAGTLTLQDGSKVKIAGLYVDKYEVTFEKYWVFKKCSGYAGAQKVIMFPNDTTLSPYHLFHFKDKTCFTGDYPVVKISMHDAKAYADWLGMRLPKFHEWEYAARAGSTGRYCFGDNESLLGDYAWHVENTEGQLQQVGLKKPNAWNLRDVHGNVAEWTSTTRYANKCTLARIMGGTCYLENYKMCSSSAKRMGFTLLSQPKHICALRGGYNYACNAAVGWKTVGFRCVRDP